MKNLLIAVLVGMTALGAAANGTMDVDVLVVGGTTKGVLAAKAAKTIAVKKGLDTNRSIAVAEVR